MITRSRSKNNGPAPNPVTNIEIVDLLPDGVTFESGSPDVGSYESDTGIWSVGELDVGAEKTLVITAVVDSYDPALGQTITNAASLVKLDQTDLDPDNNSASADLTTKEAQLKVTKSVSDSTPDEGDIIEFTIEVRNLGPAQSAYQVEVQDVLPSGLSFDSATADKGNYDSVSGIWSVGTLNKWDNSHPDPMRLTLRARIKQGTSGSTITNMASIHNPKEYDSVSGDDSASVSITVRDNDLELSKVVDNPTPDEGQTIAYTIQASHRGPSEAATTNVVISDVLPTGVTFLSATPDDAYDETTGLWPVGDVAFGETATLTIHAVVDAGTSGDTITNAASITGVDQTDPNPTNNSDSASITVSATDLMVQKSLNVNTPEENQTVEYTITVRNLGQSIATGIMVKDLLPKGVIFDSADASQGGYDEFSGDWSVGTLVKDAEATLVISAVVDEGTSGESIVNTAALTAVDQVEINSDNNSASASLTVQSVDLWVQKGVSDDCAHELQTVNYTLSVRNRGPASASGIMIQDILPNGVTFVSASPAGVYDYKTGLWTVGSLAQDGAAALTITAQVDAGVSGSTITNHAAVYHLDQFDPYTQNNSASASIDVSEADLSLSKMVDNPTPGTGDTITYTIVVMNQGPSPATGVVVHDVLPAGVSFSSAVPSQGRYDKITGSWTIGDIAINGDKTLTIEAIVDSGHGAGRITNIASIEKMDQHDPNLTDNSAIAVIDIPEADLKVNKSVDDTRPDEGQIIVYTILIENLGPVDANDVEVADVLPLGVTFVSGSADQGVYSQETGIWTIGDLGIGAQRTLSIEAAINADTAASTIINRAGVFNAYQTDPNRQNNQDTAYLAVAGADLEIEQTVNNAYPLLGDEIVYTLTLTNHGPDNASNIRVEDMLPAGISFESDDSSGAYDSVTGVWSVDNLSVGADVTLHINASVETSAEESVIVNTARIAKADQADSPKENNTADVQVAIGAADLAVTAAVDNPSPHEGETVVYSIQVSNDGPEPASSAEIKFDLPEGTRYISSDQGGTYNPATGIWQVSELTLEDSVQTQDGYKTTESSATLNLTVQLEQGTATQSIDATASLVKADQTDPDIANNQSTTKLLVHGIDLSLTKEVGNAFPQVGETVVYTVILSNDGPDDATNIVVTDHLPSHIQFVSVTPSVGEYTQDTGQWSISNLASGSSATLESRGVLIDGTETVINNVAELTSVDQQDNDSSPNNHVPSEDDYDSVEIYPETAPIVDGKLDEIYDMSPNSERVCYVADGSLLGIWHVLVQPAKRTVYAALVIDKDVVDNTYGANAIGWAGSHSLIDLVGSDYAQFQGFDADGVLVLDFQLDYISEGFITPSGYDSSGVTDGDSLHVRSWATSLSYNLNETGYCINGDCSLLGTDLVKDSPTTNVFYEQDATYPDWLFDVVYETEIDLDVFGVAGYGSLVAPFIHISPSKIDSSTVVATPGICPGEIGDYVWQDLNGDGQQDGSEPGIDAIDINLYLDNDDGVFDPGSDVLTGTETTRVAGFICSRT